MRLGKDSCETQLTVVLNDWVKIFDEGGSQQAHDVSTTSNQRRCNVMTFDVEATLYKRHVPAGIG